MLEINTSTELLSSNRLTAQIGFGGDTLNTAIYMARLGASVNYVSAVGRDKMSDWMITQWKNEGINCDLVSRSTESPPGLYMIELDKHGERSFCYWRDGSPASQLFENQISSDSLFRELEAFNYICLSGISIAILSKKSKRRLLDFLANFRSKGGRLIFDPNHRPNLWQSPKEAIDIYQEIYKLTNIALPSYEDDVNLYGHRAPREVIQSILDHGVHEVILKMGEKGCLFAKQGEFDFVPSKTVKVVDTTSAGDSFNAAYLSARLYGASIKDSCTAGNTLASIIIQHQGAVIPLSATPSGDQLRNPL